MYKRVLICCLSLLSLSSLSMTLDSDSMIKNIHNLRTIAKRHVMQDATIQELAQSFGITPRAIALHVIKTHKLSRLEAQILLKKYPANRQLNQALFNAVRANNASSEAVLELLKNNADVAIQDEDGDTAFMWAIDKDRKDIVELLLMYGADAEAQDKGGASALRLASSYGSKDMVELLLKYGADINAQGKLGASPLMGAACKMRKDIVELLLKRGADTTLKTNFGRRTCLDIAQSEFAEARDQDKKQTYKEIGKLLLNVYIEQRKRPVKKAVLESKKAEVRELVTQYRGIPAEEIIKYLKL